MTEWLKHSALTRRVMGKTHKIPWYGTRFAHLNELNSMAYIFLNFSCIPVFSSFWCAVILRKNVLIQKLLQPSFKFLPKIFFIYVSPKQWPFYGTFIKLSVHYSLNSSTFRPWFGQNSTNFMQFNNYKPVSILYSRGVPLYEVSGMFKGWRSCGDSKIVELAPWFLVSRGLVFTLFLLDCI
jgi:hypothetical protein